MLTVGVWQQATVTYTSAGAAKLFLNGNQIASGTYAGPITGNTGPVYISHPNATYDFPGSIDEVRIENVARSDAWVKAQYKSMANTFVSFGGEQSAPGVGGVLGNDTDVEGDALRAVLVSGPAHGSLSLKADGTFSYTPDADWNGTDSFTYKANDGSLDSAPATVTITVNPVNDAPIVANPIADQAATEDAAFSFQFASNTFADVDVGDTLTYTASGLPGWLDLRCGHAHLLRYAGQCRRRPGDGHRTRHRCQPCLRRRPVRAHGGQHQRRAHAGQRHRRSERHRGRSRSASSSLRTPSPTSMSATR
ncbi:MAG: Ig-like domain-containing protein [Ignavibacteriales bacterium]|nr:Ig-like domain-containing protein [Ignavibacteriales bacterium]